MAVTIPHGVAAPVPRSTRVVLWLLLAIYVMNFIDRQVVNILAEPIARELHLSNTQIGLLSGLAFAFFYTVLGLPLARVADDPRRDRATLIGVCLALWSAMTMVCGAAQGFGQLLAARFGVGIGEAGCTPTATSLIADLVSPARRSSAMSFYMLGLPIGTLLGMASGGVLAQWFGWRVAFVVVGAPGIVLALVFRLAVRDPRRSVIATDRLVPIPFAAALRDIAASRAFVLMTLASTATSFLAGGLSVWSAIYLIRVFHLSTGAVGIALGLAAGVGGIVGSLVGGIAGDRILRRSIRHVLTLPAAGALVIAPVLFVAYTTSDWRICVALLGVKYVMSALPFGPDLSMLQGVTTPATRATAASLKLFVQTLFGAGLGPLAIGVATDMLTPTLGVAALRWSLLVFSLVSLGCAWGYWTAGRYVEREIKTTTPE